MNNRDRISRDVERSLKTLNTLTPALVADLVRRAGTRAMPEKSASAGPKGKGTHSDPTLAAVIRKMSGDTSNDPIYEAVRTIALTLNDIATLSQLIDQQIRYVTEGAERQKESTIVYCQACDREVAGTPKDRIRSGYCMACYARWTRQGRPYRATFEAEISKELQETS